MKEVSSKGFFSFVNRLFQKKGKDEVKIAATAIGDNTPITTVEIDGKIVAALHFDLDMEIATTRVYDVSYLIEETLISNVFSPEMTQEELTNMHRLAQSMEKYGGSFAKSIARAYYNADGSNRTLLLIAFGDLFHSYQKFVDKDFTED